MAQWFEKPLVVNKYMFTYSSLKSILKTIGEMHCHNKAHKHLWLCKHDLDEASKGEPYSHTTNSLHFHLTDKLSC